MLVFLISRNPFRISMYANHYFVSGWSITKVFPPRAHFLLRQVHVKSLVSGTSVCPHPGSVALQLPLYILIALSLTSVISSSRSCLLLPSLCLKITFCRSLRPTNPKISKLSQIEFLCLFRTVSFSHFFLTISSTLLTPPCLLPPTLMCCMHHYLMLFLEGTSFISDGKPFRAFNNTHPATAHMP